MARDGSQGGAAALEPILSDRVLTIPNSLSVLRLVAIPVFGYLLLGPHADGLAFVVLMASGATDWLDGKLARVLNQSSRVGALLDAAADRIFVITTLLAFGAREFVPWWVIAILIARDLLLAVPLLILRSRSLPPLPVHYVGKAATFCLLYSFPLLMLGHGISPVAGWALPIALAMLAWGTFLYLWSAALYVVQFRLTLRPAPGPSVGSAPDRGTSR